MIKKKIKSNKGETIAEVLISVLIIALAMTLLAGGIMTAAKINRSAKSENMIVFANRNSSVEAADVNLNVKVDDSLQMDKYSVKIYYNAPENSENQRKLYFYEAN